MLKIWLPVVLYVVAMFAAIPYLPAVIIAFQRTYPTIFAPFFIAIFAIIVTLVLGYVVLLRRCWRVSVLLWMAVIVAAGMVMSSFLGEPAEKIHLLEYGLLGILVHCRLAPPASKSVSMAVVASLAITGAVGCLDELYQWYVPNRYFGWQDVAANVLGGALGVALLRGVLIPAASAAVPAVETTSQAVA